MTMDVKEILRPLEPMGKCTARDSSSTESNDLYSTDSPGSCATKAVLIVQSFMIKFGYVHWIPVHPYCIQRFLYFQAAELVGYLLSLAADQQTDRLLLCTLMFVRRVDP